MMLYPPVAQVTAEIRGYGSHHAACSADRKIKVTVQVGILQSECAVIVDEFVICHKAPPRVVIGIVFVFYHKGRLKICS